MQSTGWMIFLLLLLYEMYMTAYRIDSKQIQFSKYSTKNRLIESAEWNSIVEWANFRWWMEIEWILPQRKKMTHSIDFIAISYSIYTLR